MPLRRLLYLATLSPLLLVGPALAAPPATTAAPPPAPAPAAKPHLDCRFEQGKDDLVFIGKDVVIGPETKADVVLVLDGNVTVKPGARLKTLVVSNGNATLDAGASVKKSVLVVGGKAAIAQRSDVKEGVITIDDGIHLSGKDGSLDLSFNVDGEPVGKKLVTEVVRELRGCTLVD